MQIQEIQEPPSNQQLIDQNRQFHRNAIQVAGKALGPVNKNYQIVTIIGVQNSGKSTLLNYLFWTNFSVLKQSAGTRTTRGIWVSYVKDKKFIVFDVQGNDSMDRSEQQDFQKMVATFALIVANVLIINIWSKSLGQYMGSQYQTLRVIMDICIAQHKLESPKTILFCVRDFNQMYEDKYETRRKIIKDVNDIWRKIDKPPEMQQYNQNPQKFFNIEVFILRKFNQAKKQKFIQDVNQLRLKFIKQQAQDYLFAKQKTSFNLPINDLPMLIQKSWQDIKVNKKLNLPNQKDQIASFRCSTVITQIQSSLLIQLLPLYKQNTTCDLGSIMKKYTDSFYNETYHYPKHIYQSKKQQLVNSIHDLLGRIALHKINQKTKLLIDQFNSTNFVQSETKTLDKQLKQTLQNKTSALSDFMKSLHFQLIDQQNYRKQRINQLSKQLTQIIQKTKQYKLKMIQQNFQNETSKSIRLLASQLIKNYFGYDFWKQAKKQIQTKSKQIIDSYAKSYKWVTGNELNLTQYGRKQQIIMQQQKQTIKTQLSTTFQDKVIDQFKIKFWKDKTGQTINFNLKTQQQISSDFDKTRKQIQQLISKMNQFNGAPKRASLIQDTQQQNALFQSRWLSSVTQQIDKIMISEFEKTIRRKKQSSMNQVPWWMFVMILFFAYDDLWFTAEEYPITHNVLLSCLIFICVFFAIGQGKILKEACTIVMGTLKDKFPFLK